MDQAGELGRVPRGVPLLPRPFGEHGLGRPRRPHRLAGRGPGAAPRGWDGLLAGPGGRAVRVGRVPAGARTCRTWPTRPGACSPRPTRTTCRRAIPFAVGYQWTEPFRFARIEEVLGVAAAVHADGLDAAPAGRAVAAGAVAGADAPGLKPGTARHGRRGRAAAGLGLRDGQGLGPRGHLRGVGAAPEACRSATCWCRPRRGGWSPPRRCQPRS